MFIKNFNQLSKNDAHIAGGKGASLGEMTKVGLPVPPGFVILALAFDRFIEETDLNVEIETIFKSINQHDIVSVEHASEKIQSLILTARMPEDIKEEIESSFKELDTEFVAVRSSATAEDSSAASWAGELESYLNTTENTLLEAVKKCWASLFTPRAIFYRYEKEMHNDHVAVAVVIQKMVQSEVSGITFTVHPVTEDYNQMVIEAGYGLGEAIVGGMITPDTYVINKKELLIEDKNISQQEMMIVRSADGNEEKTVEFEKQELQKISDEQIIALSKICISIENHYDFPCDIEWAYEKGKFYIVQSRPITTLENSIDVEVKNKPESKNDEILIAALNVPFERYVKYPEIPVIYFEASCYCYIDNPYFSLFDIKNNYPDLISVLTENYEAWQHKSKRIIISDDDKIELIMKDCLMHANESNKYLEDYLKKVNNFTKKELKDILLKLNLISKKIYHRFIFFTDECFKTENPILLKKLPEIRMYVSETTLTLLFESFDKLLKEISKEVRISLSDLNRLTTAEIFHLLETGNYQKNVAKRPILFLTYNNELNTYFDKDVEEIYKILLQNNPEKPLIKKAKEEKIIKGEIGQSGVAEGIVTILNADEYPRALQLFKGKDKFILVTPMTRPEIVPIIKNAKAIITDEGGITCHAAIVARELNKPCIIGTKIATQVLKDGDLVEVDADKGEVKILKRMRE